MPENQADGVATKGFVDRLSQAGSKPWLPTILLGLLLPPLGLILAFYLLAKAGKLHDSSFYKLAALFIIVSVAGTAAYFTAYSTYYNTYYPTPSYTKFDEYKLPGKVPKTGISFKQPDGFVLNGDYSKDIVSLVHTSSTAGVEVVGSSIWATSIFSAQASDVAYVGAANQVLNSKDSKLYSDFIKPMEQFVKSSVPSGYDVNLGKPEPFKNANVSNNAWQFEVQAKDRDENRAAASQRGIVVLAIGKSSFYYFTINAVDHAWQANQDTWQQVLDSIKIDQ